VVGEAGVEHLTAAAAEVAMRRVAGSLRARGVGEGDRVVFALPNSAGLLAAVVGTMRAGAVAVPLNPTLLPGERAVLVADAEPALVVDDAATLAALLDGPEADLAPVPRSRPMHYTSGTTGRPKGVSSGLLSDADARALAEEEVELWGFGAGDLNLVVSPLYHSAPLRFAAATLLHGGDVVVLPRFDAALVSSVIASLRPTTAFLVPAHLQRLFALGGLPPLDSFRLVLHAGAPCPEPLKRAAVDAFGIDRLWEFYGSTEGQFTVCSSPEWFDRPGTVGRARPGRRLSIDDDGTIWCDVPPHARFEYWRAPEKTGAAWRGSAFTVGDLGRVDDDGYLWLDGRRDDLVISGGVNVYPLEVEQALAGLPGLDDVAVFGVDDERWGQRVCAAVVGDVTPDAVLAWARERLAPYKVPKEVHRVGELPRTGTGKVRRSRLADDLGLR
jgi:acyl-CoA synthetase (AMP-forming)/AMP-acid ligase II